MNLAAFKTQAQRFVSDNATGILTAGGAAGTVVTAVLTARASFKAAEMINNRLAEFEGPPVTSAGTETAVEMDTVEKVKLVWPQFIPPVVTGSATITAIIMANRMNAQKIAAMAAVYTISENRLKDLQKKVEEKLTGPKNEEIYKEMAQDKVRQNPASREVIILDGKTVLCFDEFSGRYFNSTMERIQSARLATNTEMYHHDYASLSHFYDELDIAPTGYSDTVGWNSATTGPMDIKFSTVMSPDNKPCLALYFVVAPAPNYAQLY
jgi:hypothetical protein